MSRLSLFYITFFFNTALFHISETIWQKYEITSNIPVHLLWFVITNFERQITSSNEEHYLHIYTATNHYEELQFALAEGINLVVDLEVYFGIPLPATKINIVGLPQYIPREKAKPGICYLA